MKGFIAGCNFNLFRSRKDFRRLRLEKEIQPSVLWEFIRISQLNHWGRTAVAGLHTPCQETELWPWGFNCNIQIEIPAIFQRNVRYHGNITFQVGGSYRIGGYQFEVVVLVVANKIGGSKRNPFDLHFRDLIQARTSQYTVGIACMNRK